ncbi:hypothetical protein E3N88_25051 [Mikania micrantha]|uniref:Uncharacterized protein n=1 Tax=Mikania micrantha TaxID=192012 RepID=A0A5N6N4Y9_9ASTR|nr:hypothetical protein E3N88_25051 [Mikania micrantha]
MMLLPYLLRGKYDVAPIFVWGKYGCSRTCYGGKYDVAPIFIWGKYGCSSTCYWACSPEDILQLYNLHLIDIDII